MNKTGGIADLFVFMIITFVMLLVFGIFIYFGSTAYFEIKDKVKDLELQNPNTNVTQIVEDTIGKVNEAYQNLYWISIMLIVGMIISIFVGSYMTTTHPIFVVPYFFVTIIAVIISAIISNTYGELIKTPDLSSTFEGFIGANFIMGYLPLWIAVIGIVGMIIMFARLGSRDSGQFGGGVYG